jgi:hypothetical protein
MRVFSRFSPKKVLLEDTTDSVVVLAVGDDGRRGGEVGWGDGGWRGVDGVVGGVACRPVGGGGGDQQGLGLGRRQQRRDGRRVRRGRCNRLCDRGWHPPPPPLLARWSGRGSCRATRTPPCWGLYSYGMSMDRPYLKLEFEAKRSLSRETISPLDFHS